MKKSQRLIRLPKLHTAAQLPEVFSHSGALADTDLQNFAVAMESESIDFLERYSQF